MFNYKKSLKLFLLMGLFAATKCGANITFKFYDEYEDRVESLKRLCMRTIRDEGINFVGEPFLPLDLKEIIVSSSYSDYLDVYRHNTSVIRNASTPNILRAATGEKRDLVDNGVEVDTTFVEGGFYINIPLFKNLERHRLTSFYFTYPFADIQLSDGATCLICVKRLDPYIIKCSLIDEKRGEEVAFSLEKVPRREAIL